MIYVKMKLDTAVTKGIIPADHPYPTNGEDVVFKKDVLVNSGIHVSEDEFEGLTTAKALEKYDQWQI